MITLKCRNCGGDLVLLDGRIAECQVCHSKMLLPAIDSDVRNDMFQRGNYLRMRYEFDRAASAFEQIIARDPEDAEAHFCLALCHYGVEYVRDPRSGEYKPTCHRSSTHSILEDVDYQQALQYAPPQAQLVYRQEGARLHEIWQQISDISRYEEPYDAFICYKESPDGSIDPNARTGDGRRTQDSVVAQNLYEELTQRGLRVFFSRITLENKLGRAYEPYIFAALQSARVMLVVASRREYLESVWVKNEWQRYLHLCDQDRSRTLIPVLVGMDPYDLPDELSDVRFTPREISETGVKQDLLRGVLKLVGHDEGSTGMIRTREMEQMADRFLQEGNAANAKKLAQQMLNLNPENGGAYRILFLADLGVESLDACRELDKPFETTPSFLRIRRYAVGNLRREVDELLAYRQKRAHYREALRLVEQGDYEKAYPAFTQAEDYQDAPARAAKCAEQARAQRAERERQEALARYRDAVQQARQDVDQSFEKEYPFASRWKPGDEQLKEVKRPKVFLPLLSIASLGVSIAYIILAGRKSAPDAMLYSTLGIGFCLFYVFYQFLSWHEPDWGFLRKGFFTIALGGLLTAAVFALPSVLSNLLNSSLGEGISGAVGYAVIAAILCVGALAVFFRQAHTCVGTMNEIRERDYFVTVELPQLKQQKLNRRLEELRSEYEPAIGAEACIQYAQESAPSVSGGESDDDD